MRRVVLFSLVVLLVLVTAMPVAAQPRADKDQIKLRVFIHYPKPGKPGPKPGTCDPSASNTPDTYVLTGWKHSGTVTYHVNYASIPSTVSNAQTAISNSFEVWDALAQGVDLVEGATTTLTGYKLDGVNLVAWGRTPRGAIAVTYTWAYSWGEVVEQDIIMGASLPWSYTQAKDPDTTCGDLYSYDVQNILTHEVGHIFGLDDLYNSEDQDLTMYGYGDRGELKKDTLGTGDTDGMRALY